MLPPPLSLSSSYSHDPTRNPKSPGIVATTTTAAVYVYDLLDHIRVCGHRYWIAREKKNPFGGDQCAVSFLSAAHPPRVSNNARIRP